MLQFLVAGYETTAVTISNSCYILANKPEEMQKLQDEIDSNLDQSVCSKIILFLLSQLKPLKY